MSILEDVRFREVPLYFICFFCLFLKFSKAFSVSLNRILNRIFFFFFFLSSIEILQDFRSSYFKEVWKLSLEAGCHEIYWRKNALKFPVFHFVFKLNDLGAKKHLYSGNKTCNVIYSRLNIDYSDILTHFLRLLQKQLPGGFL